MTGIPLPDGPLAPQDFVGRRRIVDDIVQRLRQPELNSTGVAGGPQSGKTSLLRLLSSERILPLLAGAATLLRVYVDAGALGSTGTPSIFWARCLKEVDRALQQQGQAGQGVSAQVAGSVAAARARALADGLNVLHLEDLFDDLASAGRPVVLMVDDFDVVLANTHFTPPADFFDQMRSLCQRRPRGLALVVGTTRALFDNAAAAGPSPFYNHFGNVKLGPLEHDDFTELLAARSAAAGRTLPSEIARRLEQASFGHPYLASYWINRVLRQPGEIMLSDEEVQGLMRDSIGPYRRLAQQIDVRLKPLERVALEAVLNGAKPTAAQSEMLERLRESSLLPPGVA